MRFYKLSFVCLVLSITACAPIKKSESNLVITEYEQTKIIADQYFSELHERTGVVRVSPTLYKVDTLSETQIKEQTQTIKEFTNKMALELEELNTDSKERYKAELAGDLIQISIKKGQYAEGDFSYVLRPVLLQISRGDSRLITVKDSEYLNSGVKQDLRITYSENYSLYVNGKNIGIVPRKKTRNFEYYSENLNTKLSALFITKPSK